ncbi:hypothetical protein ABH941_008236 [Streptacidiphilus sp. EB103A]
MRNLDRDQMSGAPHTGLGRQPGPPRESCHSSLFNHQKSIPTIPAPSADAAPPAAFNTTSRR